MVTFPYFQNMYCAQVPIIYLFKLMEQIDIKLEVVTMINLNENFVLIDAKDCPANLEYIDFDFKKKYSQINSALKINFSSDINYNTMCIKQLQYLENKNIKFCSKFGNYNVKYIISNYNQNIISGLKAISISNIKKNMNFYMILLLNR